MRSTISIFACTLLIACGNAGTNNKTTSLEGKKVTKNTGEIECVTGGSLYRYSADLTGYIENENDSAYKVRVSDVQLEGGGDGKYSRCVYYGLQDIKKRIGVVEYWEKNEASFVD